MGVLDLSLVSTLVPLSNFIILYFKYLTQLRSAVAGFLSLVLGRRTRNRKQQMTHPVDKHVGKKIRQRRWLVGMTQQQLAAEVGIKFQQIQKYETGANRVSASRLWDISEAMDVPVNFFFEGIEQEVAAAGSSESVPADLMGDKEALDLVRSYYSIPENQRRRLFDLARVLSDVA